MLYLLIGAAGLIVGGVLTLLVLQLVHEDGSDVPLVIVPKPPRNERNNKFRVVFYTEQGARARQLFEKLEPAPEPHFAERVELLHFEDRRGLKPSAS